MTSGRRVGRGSRRAQPHLIIQCGRDLLRRFHPGKFAGNGKAAGHAYFNQFDLADVSVAHPFAGQTRLHDGTPPRAALKHSLVGFDRVAHGPAVGDSSRQWLFRVEVLARCGRRGRDAGMPVIRGRIHDRIDVLSGQYLTKISIRIGLLQPGYVSRCFSVGGIHIADGHHLDPFVIQE